LPDYCGPVTSPLISEVYLLKQSHLESELGFHSGFRLRFKKAVANGIHKNFVDRGQAEGECLGEGQHLIIKSRVEKRWIVGINGDGDTRLIKPAQRMLLEAGINTQTDIRSTLFFLASSNKVAG
jgi:hypothetical protein